MRENPAAKKLANTDLARRLRIVARGEDFVAEPDENYHVNQYPQSTVPRLLAETIEALNARIVELEKAVAVLEADK
jgi:hypothetical protein